MLKLYKTSSILLSLLLVSALALALPTGKLKKLYKGGITAGIAGGLVTPSIIRYKYPNASLGIVEEQNGDLQVSKDDRKAYKDHLADMKKQNLIRQYSHVSSSALAEMAFFAVGFGTEMALLPITTPFWIVDKYAERMAPPEIRNDAKSLKYYKAAFKRHWEIMKSDGSNSNVESASGKSKV